jgi:hypothetical protein
VRRATLQKTEREIGQAYTEKRRRMKDGMIENTHKISNIDMRPSENEGPVKAKEECYNIELVTGCPLI